MKLKCASAGLFSTLMSRWFVLLVLAISLSPMEAHASIFKGETLDKVADVLTWIVLIVAPVVAIGIFLIIHILPEKIAEKKHHPQTKAIQCLCLLSLVFGGLLWPLAWLWAYTKPVLHRLAYGTDTAFPEHEEKESQHEQHANRDAEELTQLRRRLNELEARLTGKPIAEGGKS
jgi:CBS domain containing-hemolysin-like protein